MTEGAAAEARSGAPRDSVTNRAHEGLRASERMTRRERLFLWLMASGLGIIFGCGLAAALSLIRPTVFFALLVLGLLALAAGYLAASALDERG